MSTPETAAKILISNYISMRGDCFFWWQESIGQYDAKIGRFRKKRSKFQYNGIPDIMVLLQVGEFPAVLVGLEVKAGKNKQSDSQKEFELYLKNAGSFYFVVKSPEEAQKALNLVRDHVSKLTSQSIK